MDAKNNEQEIQDLLLKSEEIIKELPPGMAFGVKTIKGDRDTLVELRKFINKDLELVSEIREWRHYDASGNCGFGVAVVGSVTALSTALVAYFNSKKRKIVLDKKKGKLTVENYSVKQVERIMRCFDSIKIE